MTNIRFGDGKIVHAQAPRFTDNFRQTLCGYLPHPRQIKPTDEPVTCKACLRRQAGEDRR